MNGGSQSDVPGPAGPGHPSAPMDRPPSGSDTVIRQFAAEEWQVYRRLRLAALADAPDAFGSTLAAEQDLSDAHWEERLSTGAASTNDLPLIALVGNIPAGLAWGKIDPANPRIAHVYQMWVTPAHRRMGSGAALLGTLIEWARNRGVSELVLSVTCGDNPARRLYGRMRFEPRGEPVPLRSGSTLLAQEMRLQID